MNRVLGLIPARGGSKGIKNKNLQKLDGNISLVSNAIALASLSLTLTELYVATDSDAIQEEVTKFTPLLCQVYRRSTESATDEASTEMLISEFIRANDLDDSDIIVTIQCTNPFLDFNALDDAVKKVQSKQYNSAVSVSVTDNFFWSNKGYGNPINYNPYKRDRRQDFTQSVFIENGMFYVTSVFMFKYKGETSRLISPVYLAKCASHTVLEIDEPWELDVARLIQEKMR